MDVKANHDSHLQNNVSARRQRTSVWDNPTMQRRITAFKKIGDWDNPTIQRRITAFKGLTDQEVRDFLVLIKETTHTPLFTIDI